MTAKLSMFALWSLSGAVPAKAVAGNQHSEAKTFTNHGSVAEMHVERFHFTETSFPANLQKPPFFFTSEHFTLTVRWAVTASPVFFVPVSLRIARHLAHSCQTLEARTVREDSLASSQGRSGGLVNVVSPRDEAKARGHQPENWSSGSSVPCGAPSPELEGTSPKTGLVTRPTQPELFHQLQLAGDGISVFPSKGSRRGCVSFDPLPPVVRLATETNLSERWSSDHRHRSRIRRRRDLHFLSSLNEGWYQVWVGLFWVL